MEQFELLTLLSFILVSSFVTNGSSSDPTLVSDTVHNVLRSVQGIVGNLQDFVGDNKAGCSFSCPNGVKPKRNPNHVPSSNGCGAFGFQFPLEEEFDSEVTIKSVSKCCDKHDICYDSCGKKKMSCDDNFKDCLQEVCKKTKKLSQNIYQGCKSTVDLMYSGTVALGCKPYKDAQGKACLCHRGIDDREL